MLRTEPAVCKDRLGVSICRGSLWCVWVRVAVVVVTVIAQRQTHLPSGASQVTSACEATKSKSGVVE